ncbi:GDP-mannose transporter GONST2-like [Durio zibethinus]|uniref:GDP-mannose transporter GONST2-like n=1 Tax=Durio zibethinus TaxID=66656 RepID=A0A6P5XRG1_DURZI|nr:GDP-mannose transporter GONST2-like [Durio zibethinus]XP_022730795.1 GDP-mannose transporter GONST2-like [Durio zibethinus]
MSNIKLDQVVCHESEESDLRCWNGKVTSDEKVNRVYEILNSIHKQGQRSISGIKANAEYGTLTDRFFKGNRAALGDSFNLPFDGDEKPAHIFGRKSGPLLSGTAYCISSCSMILLNKVVLSSYNFNAGVSLIVYQNLISCLVVAILGLCRAVSVEKLNWKLIKVWIPVNIIFVGMLVSGMYSLKYINIAMVTVLKNMTNILTAIGEYYVFRKRQNQKVWTAMFMMIISAVSGGITDLSFDATGYTWQILNCILTAGYSLTLRRVMDKAKQATKSGSLNEVSMVLLNNLLSIPFAIFLIFVLNEWEYVINVNVIKLPMFWVFATASGLLGLAISFTSMWFLHQTGPTTYSLVGSLNKIPISIAGIMLFKVPLSVPNMFSILFGLFAGIFFAKAKMS